MMMRDTFEVRVRVPQPVGVVWARLIDLDNHSAAIPLTTVTPAGGRMHPGLRFVGETRLGPLHLSDRMVVERADAPTAAHPGHLVVEKFGPLAGRVEATVEQSPTGTLVTWRQSLRPAWLPAALRPLGVVVARVVYGAGLRRLVG